MPSSPSRPYKSKLFNFVNRQSLELRDHLSRVVRRLRVTAEWGAQILAYPLYLFVQAGRTVRRQLGQTVERISLSSEEISSLPLNSDRPLNKVLQEIEPWLASSEFLSGEEVTQTETDGDNFTRKFTIQGIASVLDNCYLVLVKSNNQTIDFLSPNQQEILQKLIQVETANYWYARRFKLTQSRKTPGLISSFSTNPQNVLPPVRWFWQGMRWMQTSPMATRLNLFGESFLRVKIEDQPVSSLVKQSSSLDVKYLKTVIHKVTNYFHRYSQSKQLFSETNKSINVYSTSRLTSLSSLQKKSELFQDKTISYNVNPIKRIGQKLHRWINRSLMEETNNPFQIKMLIFTAIDYILGKKSSDFKLKTNQSLKTINSNFLSSDLCLHKNKFTNQNTDNIWLSWDDLYAEETTLNSSKHSTILSVPSPQAYKKEIYLKKEIKIPLEHQSKQKRNNKNREIRPVVPSISDVKIKQNFMERISPTYPTLKKENFQDHLSKILPNWIETEAKSTGYVKHPLESILGWLDMLISWLEKLGNKLWKSLRKLTK